MLTSVIRSFITSALAVLVATSVAVAMPEHETRAPAEPVSPDGSAVDADARPREVATAFPLPDPSDLEAALPPPPKIVVRTTKMFGTVTINHEAHLARKAHCIQCHGPGPVRKIKFTPKLAHERCRGCHLEAKRGPTNCRACHVVPVAAPAELAEAEGAQKEGAGSSKPAAPGERREGGAAARLPADLSSTSPSQAAPNEVADSIPDHVALRRFVYAGASLLHSGGTIIQPGFYASILLRQDGLVMSNSIELSGSGKDQRTLGLIGVGVVRPLRPHVNGQLLALGGFDATEEFFANLAPALGVRAGVEWFGGIMWLQSMQFSLSGVLDVTRTSDLARSVALSANIGAGFDFGHMGGR